MTIDKAIAILVAYSLEGVLPSLESGREAIKLGIKALERLKEWRSGEVVNPDYMLEGETE